MKKKITEQDFKKFISDIRENCKYTDEDIADLLSFYFMKRAKPLIEDNLYNINKMMKKATKK
jgi:hypothetical protein